MMTASVLEENILDSLILLDTHVHLHQCFQVEQVLSSASKNFSDQASRSGKADAYFAGLLLTEMQGEDWFFRHQALVEKHAGELPIKDGWVLRSTSEAESLLAVHSMTNAQLAILAGRQVVTQEKLEVLALITPTAIPDGLPLEETIDAVVSAKGIPVLPWGVGKWIGDRGRIVADFLQRHDAPKVFLGDNSGRPLGWRRPMHFQVVEQKGVPVLPGTDPLPLPTEASRVGSFGLQVLGEITPQRPGSAVREILYALPSSVETFGQLEMPWRFVKNQVALRVQKTRG